MGKSIQRVFVIVLTLALVLAGMGVTATSYDYEVITSTEDTLYDFAGKTLSGMWAFDPTEANVSYDFNAGNGSIIYTSTSEQLGTYTNGIGMAFTIDTINTSTWKPNGDATSFGLSKEQLDNTYLTFDLTMADAATYDKITFGLGVTVAGLNIPESWGRRYEKNVKDYIRQQEGEQQVRIPLSFYSDLAAHTYWSNQGMMYEDNNEVPWSKMNYLLFSLPSTTGNANVTFANLKFVTVTTSTEQKTFSGNNIKIGTVGESEAKDVPLYNFAGKTLSQIWAFNPTEANVSYAFNGSNGSIAYTSTGAQIGTYTNNVGVAYTIDTINTSTWKPNGDATSFGLSKEQLDNTYLTFDLTMADAATYDKITFGLGVTVAGLNIPESWGRRYEKNIKNYITQQAGEQQVRIPLSFYSDLPAHTYWSNQGEMHEDNNEVPWSKMNYLLFSLPSNAYNANVTFANLKFVTTAQLRCEAAFGVFDADNVEALQLSAGSKLHLMGVAKNDKSTDQKMIFILTLYKNGIMEDMIPVEFTAVANKVTAKENIAEFQLPQNIMGYSLGGYMWSDFTDLIPYSDSLVLP